MVGVEKMVAACGGGMRRAEREAYVDVTLRVTRIVRELMRCCDGP